MTSTSKQLLLEKKKEDEEAEEEVEEEEEKEETEVETTRKTKKVRGGKAKQKRSTFTTREKLLIETEMLKNEGHDFMDVKASLLRLPPELREAHTPRSIEKKAREIWSARKRQAAELARIDEGRSKKQQKLAEVEEVEAEVPSPPSANKQVEEPLVIYDPLYQFQQPSTFHPIALEQNGYIYLYWPIAPTFVGYKVQVLVEPYRVTLRVQTAKLTREELDLATETFGERLPLPDDPEIPVSALTLSWRSTKRLDQQKTKDHQTPHFFLLRIRIIPEEPAIKERTDISIHNYIAQLSDLLKMKRPQEVEVVAELPALEDGKNTSNQ